MLSTLSQIYVWAENQGGVPALAISDEKTRLRAKTVKIVIPSILQKIRRDHPTTTKTTTPTRTLHPHAPHFARHGSTLPEKAGGLVVCSRWCCTSGFSFLPSLPSSQNHGASLLSRPRLFRLPPQATTILHKLAFTYTLTPLPLLHNTQPERGRRHEGGGPSSSSTAAHGTEKRSSPSASSHHHHYHFQLSNPRRREERHYDAWESAGD